MSINELLNVDVHPVVFCKEADDYFPDHDRGWQARFDEPGVRPTEMIEWEKVKAKHRE